MPDPSPAAAPAQYSISNTTAISLGTAGGGGVVLWVVDCIQAGQIVTPDREVCMFLAALLAPVVHALGRIVLYHLNRLGGETA